VNKTTTELSPAVLSTLAKIHASPKRSVLLELLSDREFLATLKTNDPALPSNLDWAFELDAFPAVEVGDMVKAVVELADGKTDVARPGDFGKVIGKEPGCCPTVAWERTGRVYGADPETEVVVVRERRKPATAHRRRPARRMKKQA
jgi:hypothetical protein